MGNPIRKVLRDGKTGTFPDEASLNAFARENGYMPEDAPTGEAPGMGSSFLRGAGQGLTAGWLDEAAAVLPGNAEANVKSSREANARAEKENPWSYGAGEVLGSIPTIAGASVLTGSPVTGMGLYGGVSSLGKSEDKKPSEAVKNAAFDAAVDSLIGKAGSAAGGLAAKGVKAGVAKVAESEAGREMLKKGAKVAAAVGLAKLGGFGFYPVVEKPLESALDKLLPGAAPKIAEATSKLSGAAIPGFSEAAPEVMTKAVKPSALSTLLKAALAAPVDELAPDALAEALRRLRGQDGRSRE